MKSKRIWLLAFCAVFLVLAMACLATSGTRSQPTAPQNNPQPQPIPLDNSNPPAQFKLTGIWESQT